MIITKIMMAIIIMIIMIVIMILIMILIMIMLMMMMVMIIIIMIIIIVSEALFYTGCDTPFQGPSLGRPILGASNHGYFALFANLRGFLIAGVRKTQETL